MSGNICSFPFQASGRKLPPLNVIRDLPPRGASGFRFHSYPRHVGEAGSLEEGVFDSVQGAFRY